MINELELIENINILTNCKVILYGAGNFGNKALKRLKSIGIEPEYFCDSYSRKWGGFVDKIRVLSPGELKQLDKNENLAIIITVESVLSIDPIVDLLKALELGTDFIFTYLGLEIAVFQNINKLSVNTADYYALVQTAELNRTMNNTMTEWGYLRDALFCIENTDSVLIYQPGKVGSTTLARSFSSAGVPNAHIHFLNGIDCLGAAAFKDSYKKTIKNLDVIKIITLVREPISRDLATVFQYIGNNIFSVVSPGKAFIESCHAFIYARLINDDLIKGERKADSINYGYQFNWFDNELKSMFGVDVFEYPFDKEKGYSIIKQENIEILVMKLEKLNMLELVIGEFIGTPDFKLVNSNDSAEKPYKYLYKNVREVINFPKEFIDLYYDSNPRMDHFYTEDEKTVFINNWRTM